MKSAHFTQIFAREGETASQRYDQLWRELELCDDLGYDYGFASVHHFDRLRPQATVYCTGAAAHTQRMHLGPMGYTAALYDPMRIVEEAVVLDNVTHGRFEVGLTTGVTFEEFRVYQADWDKRRDHTTALNPGYNAVRVRIDALQSNRRTRTIDIAAIHALLMCLDGPAGGTLYLDNLRLERRK